MSVISSLFKNIASKLANPQDATEALAQGLQNDTTYIAGEVARGQAALLPDQASASKLLLERLASEASYLGQALTRLGMPLKIAAEFSPTSEFNSPSVDISVSHKGNRVMGFNAAALPEGKFYLQVEQGGGFNCFIKNYSVDNFAEVEATLSDSLYGSLDLNPAVGIKAMKMITQGLKR